MAFKAVIFLLASLLLVTTKVSSNAEETFHEADDAKAPAKSHAPPPVKAHVPILPPVNVAECPKLCAERCSKQLRVRRCKRVCAACCKRCKCVPPGTYGNREKCGKCYTDMTTHEDKLKCP